MNSNIVAKIWNLSRGDKTLVPPILGMFSDLSPSDDFPKNRSILIREIAVAERWDIPKVGGMK